MRAIYLSAFTAGISVKYPKRLNVCTALTYKIIRIIVYKKLNSILEIQGVTPPIKFIKGVGQIVGMLVFHRHQLQNEQKLKVARR